MAWKGPESGVRNVQVVFRVPQGFLSPVDVSAMTLPLLFRRRIKMTLALESEDN